MNALLLLLVWLYRVHAENAIDRSHAMAALKFCTNALQHDQSWKSKTAIHHLLKNLPNGHQVSTINNNIAAKDDGLALSDCYLLKNHCYFKDFCIFSCDLLSKNGKESSMEVFLRLSNKLKVIGETIVPTEYNKFAFLTYSSNSSAKYYQDIYFNNPASKDLMDVYDLSTLYIDVLLEIVAKYQYIFLDFNTETTCTHAILELLFFSQRYLFVHDSTDQLQEHCEVSIYIHFLSPALALQEKVFATLAKANQQIKLITKFAYNFATKHLTLQQRCGHLYDYMIRYLHENKANSDPIPAVNGNTSSNSQAPFTVVISHFKEPYSSLAWLSKYPNYINDRGLSFGGAHPNGLHIVRDTHNAGKESSVYLNYIINQYDSLSPVTVFSQAEPVSNKYSMQKFQADIEWLSQRQGILRPENDGFAFLGEHIIPFQVGVFASHPLHLMHFLIEIGNFTAVNRNFAPGGMFLVSKEAVLRRSKAYYVRLVRLLTYAKFTDEGYTFERIWPAIFDSKCVLGGFDDCMMKPIPKDECECHATQLVGKVFEIVQVV